MRLTIAAAMILAAGSAAAEPVKVGMITTLSGGGAGLGLDMRDGFQLALDQAHALGIGLVDREKSWVASSNQSGCTCRRRTCRS